MSTTSQFMSSWTPSVTSSVSPTSIHTGDAGSLSSVLMSAMSAVRTETNRAELYSLSQVVRGAQASLTVIGAERSMGGLPATATSQLSYYTGVIENATLNLKALELDQNNYGGPVNLAGNAIFAALFGLLLVMHFGLLIRSGYIYFGVCMTMFTGLEFAGYLARALSANDVTNNDSFLCQIVCLTIAPAFLMGGIYYYLAQVVVIHGRQYCTLKPLWFTYIFVFCDVVSLLIQAAGGGIASSASKNGDSSASGTHIMVAGIAFQVASMSLFSCFFVDFVWKSYFRANPAVSFSFTNLLHLFLDTEKGSKIKDRLEPFYSKSFRGSRLHRLFPLIPLAVLASIVFVYIRCVYRVVELAQGWSGYLITHEAFVLTLDALVVFFACLIYVPFHPFFIFGKNKLSFSKIRKQNDLSVASDAASITVEEEKNSEYDLP